MLRFLLGLISGLVALALIAVGWFWFGKVPVAVFDAPLPYEGQIVSIPLHARIHKEMIKAPPIPVDEDNLLAGAHVYAEKCSVCHGFYGKPSTYGVHMNPSAPQLWEKQPKSTVIGVSDDPPGETYWKVSNGIRLTGMPSYKMILTPTEVWQVSLLLANADKPLPPAALDLLRGAEPGPPVVVPTPRKK